MPKSILYSVLHTKAQFQYTVTMAVRSSAVASLAPSANIVNVIDNVVTVGKTLTYSKAELLEQNTNQPATSASY